MAKQQVPVQEGLFTWPSANPQLIARREKKTAGQVISELARKGLVGLPALAAGEPKAVYGFRPFPKEGRIVSNELINKLREDGEY